MLELPARLIFVRFKTLFVSSFLAEVAFLQCPSRLEVCVLESFVYEAVVPFVQRKGLGWILPLHEPWLKSEIDPELNG